MTKHYQQGSIECIDYINAHNLDFIEGNVVKYITRYKYKGTSKEDLEKAKDYIEMLIERNNKPVSEYGSLDDSIVQFTPEDNTKEEYLRQAIDEATTLQELAPLCYEIAEIKGFHESKRTIEEAVNLLASEVIEAMDCLRDGHAPYEIWFRASDGKPEGFRFELADYVIRLFDLLEEFNIGYTIKCSPVESPTCSIQNGLYFLLKSATNLVLEYNHTEFGKKKFDVGEVLNYIYTIANLTPPAFIYLIIDKMNFNLSRPHKHGKAF